MNLLPKKPLEPGQVIREGKGFDRWDRKSWFAPRSLKEVGMYEPLRENLSFLEQRQKWYKDIDLWVFLIALVAMGVLFWLKAHGYIDPSWITYQELPNE